MCGIVGYVGNEACQEIILGSLERLEYRGYDSSGIATIEHDQLQLCRAVGKLSELKVKIKENSNRIYLGVKNIDFDENSENYTPVLSQALPAHKSLESTGGNIDDITLRSWSHFRSLKDYQIRSLAEEIVKQVKTHRIW